MCISHILYTCLMEGVISLNRKGGVELIIMHDLRGLDDDASYLFVDRMWDCLHGETFWGMGGRLKWV